MLRSFRSRHQQKEVDIKIVMKLEVTCRQFCGLVCARHVIIHLNLNFDLQWISSVSERNRGSKEIQTSQCNMTQNSWWTNDRKQMSHCDVDLRQVNKSMIDWFSKNVAKL